MSLTCARSGLWINLVRLPKPEIDVPELGKMRGVWLGRAPLGLEIKLDIGIEGIPYATIKEDPAIAVGVLADKWYIYDAGSPLGVQIKEQGKGKWYRSSHIGGVDNPSYYELSDGAMILIPDPDYLPQHPLYERGGNYLPQVAVLLFHKPLKNQDRMPYICFIPI